MRTKLGTFRYGIDVLSADGAHAEHVEPWVDTGSLHSQFPSSLLEHLGYRPSSSRRFRLADGSVIQSPIGPVSVMIGGEVLPVVAIYGEEGSDMLLGATTLEDFGLGADPVNKTLNPIVGLRLGMAPVNDLEEGSALALDYDKLSSVATVGGVLPCAVQNVDTNEVILVAYVNELALKAAVETRSAVFWSTSRNELWEKGKTSGETFDLLEVRVNCEQNSLLYRVRPRHGGICHTKNAAGEPRDCFYRSLDFETWRLENVNP